MGGFAAAHDVFDIVETDGMRVPTKRRAYLRDGNLQPIREHVMVLIDLSDIRFR